jgi:hypothetical protein
MKRALAIISLSIVLASCTHTEQTTSGQEYLSKYQYVPAAPSQRVTSADGKQEEMKSIDQRVREVAAVEPILKFPARIGLARIDNGALTNIPAEEAEGWDKVRQKLGSSFGEFVPVNPLVARMVAEGGPSRAQSSGVIDVIRLGAARQHLDAVLIYELISKETSRSNILAAANTTIIGGYVLPSQLNEAQGLGNALLIDVMQGYPYGTLNTIVGKKSRLSSSWGWGSGSGSREDFAAKVKTEASRQLAEEAYEMFVALRAKLAENAEKRR